MLGNVKHSVLMLLFLFNRLTWRCVFGLLWQRVFAVERASSD